MESAVIEKTRKKFLKRLKHDSVRDTNFLPLKDDSIVYSIYNYRGHLNHFTGNDNVGYYLKDFPVEWIPESSYLIQEMESALDSNVTIYDPIQNFTEEDLVYEITNTRFPDYELMILADEITGGNWPSFIELRAVADLLNKTQDINSPWPMSYWANTLKNSRDDGSQKSTVQQVIDEAYEISSFLINNTEVVIKSMEPFEDAVTALPDIVYFYEHYLGCPAKKLDYIEDAKIKTHLPRVCLWFIIHSLDRYNGRLTAQQFQQTNLNILTYCYYLVYTMRDLIDSYKDAYPSGYFSRKKSARSAMVPN